MPSSVDSSLMVNSVKNAREESSCVVDSVMTNTDGESSLDSGQGPT